MNDKPTMTVKEMSRYLGVSLPKAYELTEIKGFPVLRLGRRKVVPTVAFERWLEDAAKSSAG